MTWRTPSCALAATALAAAGAVGLVSGCGSSAPPATTAAASTAVRASAAADMPPTCPAQGSTRFATLNVANRLSVPVQAWFNEVNCAGWNGKTPAYYSGRILEPGTELEVLVEPNGTYSRTWRTTIRTPDGRTNLASLRQEIIVNRGGSTEFGTEGTGIVAIPASLAGGTPARARMDNGLRTLSLEYAQ